MTPLLNSRAQREIQRARRNKKRGSWPSRGNAPVVRVRWNVMLAQKFDEPGTLHVRAPYRC